MALATGRREGESDARLLEETRQAHALGLRVALKPHLWVAGGAWQGLLDPGSDEGWRAFFASYRRFILHYAALAARARADLFVIGTELGSATRARPGELRALIGEVRRLYRGPLTYAANWDEAAGIPFWDALDYVGVDEYQPLARHRGATAAELRAGAAAIAAALEQLARRAGRPVLLTEVGYRSAPDCAVDPAAWPEHTAPVADEAAQAAAYDALLGALWGRPWLAGIYVWKWFSDSRDETPPHDFSPAGKRAEAVLRAFYGERSVLR